MAAACWRAGLAAALLMLACRLGEAGSEPRCLVAGGECLRFDYSKPYCVPLEMTEDKPITFRDGKLKFPAIPTHSEDYCTKYLHKYPWISKEKDSGKKLPAWHRTDWEPGSCDCVEWDKPRQQEL